MGISLSGLTESSTGNLTISAGSGNDVLIGNGSTQIFIDGGTDTLGIGGIAVSGSRLNVETGAVALDFITSTGTAINVIADTVNDTSGAATLAIVPTVQVGVMTYTASNAMVYTDIASLYIAGIPVASNAGDGTVTFTNPAYALWVDDGAVRFDDRTFWIGGIAYEFPSNNGGASEFLQTDGSGNLSWSSVASAAVSTTVTVTDNEATNENNLIPFIANAATATGNHGLEMDGDFTYSPNTGTVTATNFSGNLTGTLQTAAQGTITSVGTLTDLTVSGTSTTIGTVTSGIWNAGAVTSSGAITGASLVADLTTLDGNALSTSSGNLAIRAATGADVHIGDNVTLIYVDGGINGGLGGVGLGNTAEEDTPFSVRFPTYVPQAGQNAYAISFQPKITEAASGTHANAVGFYVGALALTNGNGATANAASMKIAGAPTGATPTTSTSALWVAGGTSRFDGDINLDANLNFIGAQTITTTASGKLTLDSGSGTIDMSSDILDNVSGVISDVDTGLMRDSASGVLLITGGTSWADGAYIELYGEAHGSLPGAFEISTTTASQGNATPRLHISGNAATVTAAWTNTNAMSFDQATTISAAGDLTIAPVGVLYMDIADSNAAFRIVNAAGHKFFEIDSRTTRDNILVLITPPPTSETSEAAINRPTLELAPSTLTLAGSVGVTSMDAGLVVRQLTITDTSALTVAQAHTVYIAGAPIAAGSVTITNPLALWVGGGTSRFDGAVNIESTGTAILRLKSDTDANSTDDAKIVFYNDGASSSDATWTIGHDGSDSESFKISQGEQVDTAPKLTILTGGNVGIGVTGPLTPLDMGALSTGTQVIGIRNNSNSRMGLGVDTNYGMRLYAPSDVAAANKIFNFGTMNASDGSTFVSKMTITSAGRVFVGTGTPIAVGGQIDGTSSTTPYLQLARAGDVEGMLLSAHHTTNSYASHLTFLKSGNPTINSYTTVADDEYLGGISWTADDGSDYNAIAAQIRVEVDGTVAANKIPGRMHFKTTLVGATTPLTRMTILNNGNVGIADSTPAERFVVYENKTGDYAAQIKNVHAGGSGLKILGNNYSFIVRTAEESGTEFSELLAVNPNYHSGSTPKFSARVGIGVIASNVWSTLQSTLFLRSERNVIHGDASHVLYITQNAYVNVGNSWRYTAANGATNYYAAGGNHYFRVAGSGSADAAITWKTGMTISSGANVSFGSAATDQDVTFYGANSGRDMHWDAGENSLKFDNDVHAKFGDDSELQIYHDGSNSYIAEAGTGALFIQSADVIKIRNINGEQGINMIPDGAVELYHNGVLKLATTSTGISVGAADVVSINANEGDITNVRQIYTDNVVGDADTNTYIKFAGSDIIEFYTGGTKGAWLDASRNFYHTEHLIIPAQRGLYFDGGGNTYIKETSADTLSFFTNANAAMLINNAGNLNLNYHLVIQATKAFYLDGGSNTYIKESASDTVSIYTGGSEAVSFGNPDTNFVGNVYAAADKDFIAKYQSANNSYAARLNWQGLTLGNNGTNYMIAGQNATGGFLTFVVNNAADTTNNPGGHNGTVAMIMAANGNIGVGTDTSPDYKLDVQGTGRFDSTLSLGSNLDLGEGNIDNVGQIYADRYAGDADTNTYMKFPGSDVIEFYTGGTRGARLDASRNFYLDQHLIVNSGYGLFFDNASDTYIKENSANVLRFTTGGSTVLDLENNSAVFYGNVKMAATTEFYLDGGSDTYIKENSANIIRIVTGGTAVLELGNNNATFYGALDMSDQNITSVNGIYADVVYGDADQDTYMYFGGGNVISYYTAGTLAMQLGNNNLTAKGNITIPTTLALYLDGGSDTYIRENSGNQMQFVTGGNTAMYVGNNDVTVYGHLKVSATNGFYLDGGSDTYIKEDSANRIQFVTGGSTVSYFRNNEVNFYGDVKMQALGKLYLDGGSDTYILEASANTISIYTNGGETMRIGATSGIGSTYNLDLYGYNRAINGAAGTPSYTFTSDTNTGMYRKAADQLGFTQGGNLRMWIDGNLNISEHFVMAATKSIYFDGGGDTYIKERSANTLAIYTGSTEVMRLAGGGLNIYTHLSLSEYNITNVGYLYADRILGDADTNTFVDFPGSDVIGFYTGNAIRGSFTSSGHLVVNNNLYMSSTMGLYFDGGSNTYIKEISNDVLGFYVGSANALKLTQESLEHYSSLATASFRVGRDSSQRFDFAVGDTWGYFDYIQDSDSNAEHPWTFRNLAAGSGDNRIQFETGGAVRLVIADGGNVGIGPDATPNYLLDVQGTGRFDSTLSVGGVLTIGGGSPADGKVWTATDSNGVGNWETPSGGGSGTISSGTAERLAYYTGSTTVNDSSHLNVDETNGRFYVGVEGKDIGRPLVVAAPSSGDTGLFVWNRIQSTNSLGTGGACLVELHFSNTGNPPDPAGGVLLKAGKEGNFTSGYDTDRDTFFEIFTLQNGSHNARFRINSSGNVTGTYGNYHTSSDERLKDNIVTIPNALAKVTALRGVNFTWKAGNKMLANPGDRYNMDDPSLSRTLPPIDDTGTKMGLIAQEVEAVIPEIVHTSDVYRDADGVVVRVEKGATPPAGATPTKSVEYEYLTGLLIEAIKELKEEINVLTARIVVLEG